MLFEFLLALLAVDDIFNESNNLDITGAAQDETQIQDDEAQIQEDEEIRTQNVESQGHGSRISVKLVADTGNSKYII